MVTAKKDEFDALFLKVAQNKLSLNYIDEVLGFYQKLVGHDDFNIMEFKCKNLASLMYAQNGFPAKSL